MRDAPLPGTRCDGPDGVVRPHWRGAGPRARARSARARCGGAGSRRASSSASTASRFNVYGDARGLERPWPLDPVPVVLAPDEFARARRRGWRSGRAARPAAGRSLRPAAGAGRGAAAARGGAGAPGPPARLRRARRRRAGASCTSTPPIWCARPTGELRVLADRTQAPAGRRLRAREPDRARARAARGVPRLATRSGWRCSSARCARRWPALAPHGRENPRIVLLTAGPLQRDLLRAGVPGAVPRLPAGRGGRSDRARRARLPQDAGRPAPGRRHPAPPQRRLLRSAGAAAPTRCSACPGCCRRRATGTVAIANALGSGVAADAGADPVPARRSAAALLGEELQLPSVETWWCGQPDILDARARRTCGEMVIKPAYPAGRDASRSSASAARRRGGARQAGGARCARRPAATWRSAASPPSTMPVIEGDELRPRSLVLRTFVVADGVDGYQTMPGALAVVGGGADERDISIARGAAQQGHLGDQRRRGQRVHAAAARRRSRSS